MPTILDIVKDLPEDLQSKFLLFYETIREELLNTATKEDLAEVKEVLKELSIGQQKNTEAIAELRKNIEELWKVTSEHTKAISELQKAIAELREIIAEHTQAIFELRNDIIDLKKVTAENTQAIVELRKATNENTQAIVELRKATKENTEGIAELKEVQKRTEKEIARLSREMVNVKKELGGLSHSVGFNLENESYKGLPKLLKEDFGLSVVGRLKREFITDDKGNEIEANIIGEARKNGKVYTILGEAKTNLSQKHINEFLRRTKSLKKSLKGEPLLIFVTHMTHPSVEQYALKQGIRVYYSYQF